MRNLQETIHHLAERFVTRSVERERSPSGRPRTMDPYEWGAWLASSTVEQKGTSVTIHGNPHLYREIRRTQAQLEEGFQALDPTFSDALGNLN